MKWLLIVYLGFESNFAVVDQFETQMECAQKEATYARALMLASSELVAKCVRM